LLCAGERVSFGELWSRIAAAACCLSDCGVRAGDRVLLEAPSVPAFAYAYFATHLLGAVAVPMDPNATAARRAELIGRTRPAIAFGAAARTGEAVAWRTLDELKEAPAADRDFRAPEVGVLADLIFTTGITGRPKGVQLTQRNLAAAAVHINAVIGTTESDTDVVPLPLYHAFGLGRLRCVLCAGGAVVLIQGFRLPGEIFAALERYAATGLVGVPAGFAILLQFGERGLGPFARQLRYIEIGSAPMPLEHKKLLMKLLPHTKLFMHYGLTEAARSGFSEFHRDRERLDSAALPSPGVRMEARDEEGKPCAPGVPGMLWVTGGHVSPGYWEEPGLTAGAFVDGWMRTGDVAHLDEEGFMYLRGREDDMINVAGVKVAPDEVERVLAEHPAISEAACVGVPDPRKITGQVVRAYLVLASGQARVPDAELSQWVAGRLESHKVPNRFVWVTELPRTSSGKLVRRTLREQARSGQ